MAETEAKLAGKYANEAELSKGYREIRGALELSVPDEKTPLVGEGGMFRDVPALEAAYKDLETVHRRVPAKKAEPKGEPKPPAATPPKADEGSSLRITPEGESEGDPEANLQTIETVLTKAGLKSEDVVEEWTKNGKLTPEQYTAFGRSGWKKEAVDGFIAGQHAIVQLSQMKRQAAVEKAETAYGGKEQVAQIRAWAATNVPKATLDALGAQLDKDESYYPEYIGNLASLYTAKNGASGRIIEGGGGGGVAGVKTFADFNALEARANRGDAVAQKALISMTEDQIKALK